MKVLMYSAADFDQQSIKPHVHTHVLSFTEKSLNLETVNLASGMEGISLFSGDYAGKEILHKLYDLGVRFITTRSVGYEHINVEAARKVGIAVANVPAYSPYSVSEHAVTLLLALVRNLKLAQEKYLKQDFTLEGLLGFDLNGKKVGVVGCGRIGSNIAKIMNGFGCEIMVSDPVVNQHSSYKVTSFSTLLKEVDIVFLSCPLNENTFHLIGPDELITMQPHSIIINVGRGALVDTDAIINALSEGLLGGYGADVYEFERGLYFNDWSHKVIDDLLLKKLQSFPNVLLTPHMGFFTKEALEGRAITTLNNLDQWENFGTCDNEL